MLRVNQTSWGFYYEPVLYEAVNASIANYFVPSSTSVTTLNTCYWDMVRIAQKIISGGFEGLPESLLVSYGWIDPALDFHEKQEIAENYRTFMDIHGYTYIPDRPFNITTWGCDNTYIDAFKSFLFGLTKMTGPAGTVMSLFNAMQTRDIKRAADLYTNGLRCGVFVDEICWQVEDPEGTVSWSSRTTFYTLDNKELCTIFSHYPY